MFADITFSYQKLNPWNKPNDRDIENRNNLK